MEGKTLSIITNFGCHYTCPECIVKNNDILVPKTTLQGLDELDTMFHRNQCRKVSVSGGGDPLYKYEEHTDWYRSLFKWALSYSNGDRNRSRNYDAYRYRISNYDYASYAYQRGVPIEMHTSYLTDESSFPFYDCYRVVYHAHTIADLEHIKRTGSEKVRVVFVVTPEFTVNDLMDIALIVDCSDDIDELSFRQYIDKNYGSDYHLARYLELGHKKLWYYIEQCDYNLYYAENKVYTCFKDFQKGVSTNEVQ